MGKICIVKFVYVLILASFCLSTIYSCNDDSVNNSSNHYNLVTSINGVISDLPSNASIIKGVVKLEFLASYLVDSMNVDSNNVMRLNLNPPPSEVLFNVVGFFANDTVSCNNI